MFGVGIVSTEIETSLGVKYFPYITYIVFFIWGAFCPLRDAFSVPFTPTTEAATRLTVAVEELYPGERLQHFIQSNHLLMFWVRR